MSHSWDLNYFQQQNGGGSQSQQFGSVKLFDPTQFQTEQQQSHLAGHEGTSEQQHNAPNASSGLYFNPGLQQGQESNWNAWSNRTWNTEDPTQNLAPCGQVGQVSYFGTKEMNATADCELHGQPGELQQTRHTVDQPQQGQPHFYTSQQSQNGSVAPGANLSIPVSGGMSDNQTAVNSYPGWNWDLNQGQWAPAENPNVNQQQILLVQNSNVQTPHFYEEQQQQNYFIPSSNVMETAQGYWNENTVNSQNGEGQRGEKLLLHTDRQELNNITSYPGHSDAGVQQLNRPESIQNQGICVSGGKDDISSTSFAGITSQSPGNISKEHLGEWFKDSSLNSTMAGYVEHGGDKTLLYPYLSTATADTTSIQHLEVTTLQRTDSGISNASLQTLNLSADEDISAGVEELTGKMGSLQVERNQNQQHTSQLHAIPGSGNYSSDQENVVLSASREFSQQHTSQLHAGPGNFSGSDNSSSGQENVVLSASREFSQQSPVMNDWEFVPPQAHSSTLHSRNSSLDDGITFTAKEQELTNTNDLQLSNKSSMGIVPAELNPLNTQSGTTQDSESFTAISSTSSGDAQNSQESSCGPAASSTPFTSPGTQSLFSQPSSAPGLQSSSQKTLAPAHNSSQSSAIPKCNVSREKNKQKEQESSLNVQFSPEKIAENPQHINSSDKIQPDCAVNSNSAKSEKSTVCQDEVRSEKRNGVSYQHGKERENSNTSTSSRRHHSAFHPVHSQRAKENMSPATTLWDNLDTTPTSNILLAPAAPLIVPLLDGNSTQSSNVSSFTKVNSMTTISSAQPSVKKSSSSSSLEKQTVREGGRKGREKEAGRYGTNRRVSEKGSLKQNEELSQSRDEDSRSLGSLDELDATPDDTILRGGRGKGYGREPQYDSYYDRPSSRSDGYRDDHRRSRDYRSYGYRDSYYDERYDRPRSRQDEERFSRPSSRTAREIDQPKSRVEYERDHQRDPYRGGYHGYDSYAHSDYYDEDRERIYRYYSDNRDWRYRHGYAEEMGQYYGQAHQYDSRYPDYYGHLYPPRLLSHHIEDLDQSSIGSHSREHTPAFDDCDPSSAQDYYSQSSRPSSRTDRDKEKEGYRSVYNNYSSGYDGYGRDYYNSYHHYPFYNYQQYGEQQQRGYHNGRMTPPKYILPHVRVCFGPTGQLVTVLPTRPSEGQPATVEIHDVHVLLQDHPEVEELKIFPGPLVRNETHKNDVLLYCQGKAKQCADSVDMLDRESAELIWRLLELLLKQNGTIIGTDLSDLLLAGHEPSTHEYSVSGLRISQSSDPLDTPDRDEDSRSSSPAVRRSVDRTVITASQQLEESTDRFRSLLLYGRKKEALEWGMKHNLWGHALFLASKMDNRTHASVMTRFANTAMRMNDPLQTLYQLMSGRQPASVTNVVDERWGDWRPHLAMILSNHSSRPDLDKKSIIALGDTLATKHCLHASHFCYLMAQVDFGSFFKKTSKIVLIGVSHTLPLARFANNEAIQCTEVYEYAQSLGNSKFNLQQYQVYKFIYACRLADCGLAQEAFHYFEVIANQVLMNPRHYHPNFLSILYSLCTQLKYGDPQKLLSDPDAADPSWLTDLCTICQSYEDGSIQFKSGSATPMAGYGGITPSSESGELANYSMDGNAGGMYSQDSSTYASNSCQLPDYVGSSKQWSTGQDATAQPQSSGTHHYQQYSENQQVSGDQYSWLQQQTYHQQQDQQIPLQQQQYDPVQYFQDQQTQLQQQQNDQAQQWKSFGTDSSLEQHQQMSAVSDYSSYNQQQRNSVTSQNSGADQTEFEEDEDGEEHEATSNGSNFDYFGAASKQKIVAPKSRYRTTSTSSTGSTSERRKRTVSGSSVGSVQAANKPPSKPAELKKNSSQQQKNGNSGGVGGFFGGFLSKFRPGGKNEMKLPDDKNPSIVWDSVNKKWINKDGDESEGTVIASPPKDNEIMVKLPPSNAARHAAVPKANGPPNINRFSRQKGRGARGQYVDVFNPKSSNSSVKVPPDLFNVMPEAQSSSSFTNVPQLLNPSVEPTASSSQTKQDTNSLAPPDDLSRSSSLSSLSREIQQLTMKAQEFGENGSSQSAVPAASQQSSGVPMMFNPAYLSQAGSQPANSAASGMKYGHRRIYPK